MWGAEVDPVFWYEKKKNGGGGRPICRFSPVLMSRHKMLEFAVRPQLQPDPGLFGIPQAGRSRDDAVRAIRKLVLSGHSLLAEVDVKNCYQSINPDALYELPLPKQT
ncbi:hypothetical protein B5M07_01200 [Sulfitobacter sp. D7]|nr:hypothetical protein B5M07_01200 [Sulfitobacter sp. D7]